MMQVKTHFIFKISLIISSHRILSLSQFPLAFVKTCIISFETSPRVRTLESCIWGPDIQRCTLYRQICSNYFIGKDAVIEMKCSTILYLDILLSGLYTKTCHLTNLESPKVDCRSNPCITLNSVIVRGIFFFRRRNEIISKMN